MTRTGASIYDTGMRTCRVIMAVTICEINSNNGHIEPYDD